MLEAREYITLLALRAITKSLERLITYTDAFRDSKVRTLVASCGFTLRECVTEIEGYAPEWLANENVLPDRDEVLRKDALAHKAQLKDTRAVRAERARLGLAKAASVIHTCACGRSIRGPAFFKHQKKCGGLGSVLV